jgi:acyl dehydratase
VRTNGSSEGHEAESCGDAKSIAGSIDSHLLLKGCKLHVMAEGHYYEDFAIGQRFHSSSFRMERDRITAFAEEFDPQPQHLSEGTAARSQFGELVASGWHTAAVSMRLFIVEALPPIAGGGQGAGIQDLAWPHVVRPGDELRVEAEVMAARISRSRPDKGLVTIRSTTLNQNGDVVMTATHTVMVRRSKAAAE